jgi:hypothetical protein
MTQLDTVELNAANAAPFDIEEVQLQFNLQSEICKLFVRNNIVNLLLLKGLVYRIDLESPENVVAIKLTMHKDAVVSNAWIDTHSHHLIIKSTKNEFFYINQKSDTFQTLSKLKNLNVSSICFFERCVDANYTGPLLVATSNGLLLEYALDSGKETICKTILKNKFNVNYIANTLLEDDNHGILTYVVSLFTSEGVISNFTTKIPLHPSNSVSVFQNLAKAPSASMRTGSVIGISQSDTSLAFLESSSIFLMSTQGQCDDLCIKQNFTVSTDVMSFIITEYFIMVLTYENTLEVYNQLDFELITTLSLNVVSNKMIGISYDAISRTYWLYSRTGIYEIIVDLENSGVVDALLKQKRYDEALLLISDNDTNKAKRNSVLRKKGYHLLNMKNYKSAIDTFLGTDEPFEKVALELFELSDKSVLRYYLKEKLDSMGKHQKSQRYLLSSWIVESYVQELNSIGNKRLKQFGRPKTIIQASDTDENNDDHDVLKYEKVLSEEFHNFLTSNINSLDNETTYQIIVSHNRSEDMLYFAKLVKDYQSVVNYFIVHQDWDGALSILTGQQNSDLIYNSSTVLLVNHASATVETWMRLIDDLDPLRFTSALITYNKIVAFPQGITPENNQALRFMKFLIYEKRIKSRMIHNLFFSTLVTYPNLEDENTVLKHLEKYQSDKRNYASKLNAHEVSFDYDFILRLCLKFDKIQSAVFIYSILEKYEEAVSLALSNGMTQNAIRVADKLINVNDNQRKHLWLKISKSFINNISINKDYMKQNLEIFDASIGELNDKNQIYLLLKYLTDKCELISIKDLLALFPDFIVIDNFKESLVESLEKLSLKMNQTSEEMDSTLDKCDVINAKINNFEAKNFQVISPYDSCELCHKLLTIRRFIVFPCTHAFHQDCLVRYILDSNDYKSKNSIYKLQKKISMSGKNSRAINVLKKDIDELLSKSCVLCSETKINEIDEPLIKAGDKSKNKWDI